MCIRDRDVRERPKGRGQRFYTEKWAAFEDDDQTMMGFMFTIPYVVNFDGHACKMNGIGGAVSYTHLDVYKRQLYQRLLKGEEPR